MLAAELNLSDFRLGRARVSARSWIQMLDEASYKSRRDPRCDKQVRGRMRGIDRLDRLEHRKGGRQLLQDQQSILVVCTRIRGRKELPRKRQQQQTRYRIVIPKLPFVELDEARLTFEQLRCDAESSEGWVSIETVARTGRGVRKAMILCPVSLVSFQSLKRPVNWV